MKDLRIKIEEPSSLFCDNKSAIRMVHDPVQHDRMTQVEIEIDCYFIKHTLEKEKVSTSYIGPLEQSPDILPK